MHRIYQYNDAIIMIKHIIQRLCSTILLLLAVSFFTFWLMHATPGNFFDSLRLNPQISPGDRGPL